MSGGHPGQPTWAIVDAQGEIVAWCYQQKTAKAVCADEPEFEARRWHELPRHVRRRWDRQVMKGKAPPPMDLQR